ncbi:MAG: hypothetical protein WCW53_09165 [Syntrophales bacterium]
MGKNEDREKSKAYQDECAAYEAGLCKQLTDIHLQNAKLKNIDPELKRIFSVRLYTQLLFSIKSHTDLEAHLRIKEKDNPGEALGSKIYSEINIDDITTIVANDLIDIFLKEIETKGIRETLSKANNGDRRAIYKLVIWDKTAISLDFVVERMSEASFYGDKEFIETIADALKKKVAHKGKEKNRVYVAMLRHWIPYYKAKGLSVRQIGKKISNGRGADIFRSAIQGLLQGRHGPFKYSLCRS